jgi:hypothetical protein
MERELLLVGNIVIGRDPACHVSEPDPLLSRRHAEVIVNVHGVSVRDLNSRNGILVNGAKTREQVLLPGDVVQLGHMQLRYVEENVRPTDAQARGAVDPRRQQQPAAYDVDRFRPDPTPQPNRWRPEPTPLPSSRRPVSPTPQIPMQQPPVPRGRAAFDETIAVTPPRGLASFDQTIAAPRGGVLGSHDTTLGHTPADFDATMLAPRAPSRESMDRGRWPDPDATMAGPSPVAPPQSPDATMTPGDATFASALAHLAGLAEPGQERTAPPAALSGSGARVIANADLTVTDATPACAELLGIPGEQLIGDSLADVFLRAVRRAYAESNATVSLALARDARGSISVTFTLNRTSGTE